MTDPAQPKLSKAAYLACFLGDAALLVIACVLYSERGATGLTPLNAGLIVLCGLTGGLLACLPFFLEYRGAVRMVEASSLAELMLRFESIQEVSEHIKNATSHWQSIHESAGQTVGMSKQIADKMSQELTGFAKFMEKANDGEKNTLRLEIEKLRRSEQEFIHIIVRMLDHTFALHQASVRSGESSLIQQLGNFQAACRDVARRVGLVPYVPNINDPFDAAKHRSSDSQAMPVSNARISEVIATGFSYQGTLLRPALVSLQNPEEKPAEIKESANLPVANPTVVAPSQPQEQSLL